MAAAAIVCVALYSSDMVFICEWVRSSLVLLYILVARRSFQGERKEMQGAPSQGLLPHRSDGYDDCSLLQGEWCTMCLYEREQARLPRSWCC